MAGSASLTARLNDVAFPTGPEELQPSIAGLYLCVDVIYLFVFFRRGRGLQRGVGFTFSRCRTGTILWRMVDRLSAQVK